jgi:hypothetical protein
MHRLDNDMSEQEFISRHCQTRLHCETLLSDERQRFKFDAPCIRCPFGVTLESAKAEREKREHAIQQPARTPGLSPRCIHLGEPTGKMVECATCAGHVTMRLFACSVFGECTMGKKTGELASCETCDRYEPRASGRCDDARNP